MSTTGKLKYSPRDYAGTAKSAPPVNEPSKTSTHTKYKNKLILSFAVKIKTSEHLDAKEKLLVQVVQPPENIGGHVTNQ